MKPISVKSDVAVLARKMRPSLDPQEGMRREVNETEQTGNINEWCSLQLNMLNSLTL